MTLTDEQFWHYEDDIMKKTLYNTKYKYVDLSKYVKLYGKTCLKVPKNYTWEKVVISGIGKVNVYAADEPFLTIAEERKGLDVTSYIPRMTCPNSLSKYMRFHEQGTPSAYEIDYKEGKFYVTKLEVDENDI